ncbi:MAG: hypothetical protein H6621_12450 [Halobacteriovoraceae bacterium]|nr:hypothetical protein [Halobacteriovoraceae bacterium]
MRITGPRFTFTDLQARNDLRTKKKNTAAMAVAIELDKPAKKSRVINHRPSSTSPRPYSVAKDLNYHMQFTRLL